MRVQAGNSCSRALVNHLNPSLLLLALVASGATLACSGNAAQSAQADGPPGMPVKVEEAQATAVNDASEYVATLKSRDSAVIMPQVEGQVTKIFVHSGDAVAAGAPLMEIDPLKQQATVKSQESSRAAQQANLNWTKQQYERSQGLYSAGVVSKQDLDQAKSAMDAAQAQMDSLDAQVREQEVQLHYYRVAAPWSGIVGDVPVHVGDRVASHDAAHHRGQARQSRSLRLCADRTVLTAQDEPAGAGARQRRQGAGRTAASASSRRRWITRRKPCW